MKTDTEEQLGFALTCAKQLTHHLHALQAACLNASFLCRLATMERDSLRNQWVNLPKSGRHLGEILAGHGVIDVKAIDDPEGYDGGTRLAQLERAYSEIITGMKP